MRIHMAGRRHDAALLETRQLSNLAGHIILNHKFTELCISQCQPKLFLTRNIYCTSINITYAKTVPSPNAHRSTVDLIYFSLQTSRWPYKKYIALNLVAITDTFSVPCGNHRLDFTKMQRPILSIDIWQTELFISKAHTPNMDARPYLALSLCVGGPQGHCTQHPVWEKVFPSGQLTNWRLPRPQWGNGSHTQKSWSRKYYWIQI